MAKVLHVKIHFSVKLINVRTVQMIPYEDDNTMKNVFSVIKKMAHQMNLLALNKVRLIVLTKH